MLKIISAGAGSGKTYRLTQEMTALLKAGTVRPAGLIATTFTNKAAAELRDRVRIKLLEEGLTEQANALSNALIGTVHGLGVKLLQRFAFEAGVSPQVEIIPDEDHQRLFNLSMAAVISVETIERLEVLCRRLGLEQMGEAYNWRKDVRQLVEVIRANDFSKEELQSSKAQSFASLAEFLPSPTGPSLPVANEKLLQLLDSTQEALDNNENDGTKTTLSAAQTLRNLARELKQRGELSWPKWAFLCKFGKKVGAKSRELVNDLTSYAATHTELPDFQLDIKSFIELIFDCAQAAITEYDRFKKSRGQIDYTDMEVLVLRLLENSEVRTTLSEELDLLMVDEFQDTSPIQLSIFLKLSSLANQSIWVGDPKQSIYGFRGAEPRLMAAVIQAAGGIRPENIQAHSWRSREDLVYLTNSLFVRAFPDIPQEEVRLIPRRTRQGDNKFGIPPESTEQANSTALWHWHYELDGKGQIAKTWTNNVLARSIKDLLDNPPVIRPKSSKEYRQLIPSDVAVLCRSNYGCVDMARALQQAGLAAAVARNGLLETAESVLLLACMKYMLDGEDSLSAAEIMLLASRKPLVDIVDHRMDYLTEVEEAPNRYQLPTWGNDDSFIAALEAMRKQTQEFSPAELLNHILEVLDLRRIIVAWGNGEQRLANIDELRRLALAYEENCHQQQQAASIGGLLLYLARLKAEQVDKQGASERPEAVNVLTYHKSKGLEWPIVICHDLDQPLRADLWGINIVSEQDEVDLEHPLAGRWLRYWVNPYGKNTSGLPLLDALAKSDWQKEKTQQAKAEEARLLYVGITRARDYLVLPTTKKGAPWLDRVFKADAGTVLEPHTAETPFTWEGHEIDKQTQIWTEPRTLPVAEVEHRPIPFLADQRPGPDVHTPLYIGSEQMVKRFKTKKLNTRLLNCYFADLEVLKGLDNKAFGQVVAAFLWADNLTSPLAEREEMATGLIERFGLSNLSITLKSLLERSSAFQATLPKGKWRRYQPLRYQDGSQHYVKQVDLLIEDNNQTALIQNLIITGSNWQKKLTKCLPEYQYLAWVIEQVKGQALTEAFVHLPVQGMLLKLNS